MTITPRNLDDIEQEIPFVTYAWFPPLCPWCGSWLRRVDFTPAGLPLQATAACPFYHGLLVHGQKHWIDFRPPAIQRGSDGAWWTTFDAQQFRSMSTEF